MLNNLSNFSGENHNAYKIKFEIKHAYEDVFIDSNVVLYVPNEIYLDTYAYINRNYSTDDKHTKYVLIETQSSLSDTSLYLKHLQSWIVDNQTNNLKNMKKGDLCFFYHSNIGKEIVGIVKVIKEFFLDKTDETGKFVAVTVRFKNKFLKPIKLEEIKKNKELSHLSLIKQSRLSVMPIDSKSWKILNKMGNI